MAENSRISWTHHTFNPWVGCVHDSTECLHCYAEAWAKRAGRSVWGRKAERPRTAAAYWRQPVKWNREAEAAGERRRVFCGSLCDVFEGRPDQEPILADLWPLIRATPHLDWLLLTKRPQNIVRLLPRGWFDWTNGYPNVWLGTTCGAPSSPAADLKGLPSVRRLDHLALPPAVVRFVSYEPALETPTEEFLGFLADGRIDWLIYGGESGPGHRPEGEPDDPKAWARTLREACARSVIAFWHKQNAGPRPGTGVELDGEIIHQLPRPIPTALSTAARNFG